MLHNYVKPYDLLYEGLNLNSNREVSVIELPKVTEEPKVLLLSAGVGSSAGGPSCLGGTLLLGVQPWRTDCTFGQEALQESGSASPCPETSHAYLWEKRRSIRIRNIVPHES